MAATVQILSSSEIDPVKWNKCINSNDNGLIYSRYEYLDAICDNWSGLVSGNYAGIMALPWRKKAGIRYYYEPPFIQQLGYVGSDDFDVKHLFQFAKYGDLLFNFSNAKLIHHLAFARPRTNLVIDLSQGYNRISSGYKRDLLQNLRKAEKGAFTVQAKTNVVLAVQLHKKFYQSRISHVPESAFKQFEHLCLQLQSAGNCFTRMIEDANGELLSIGLFLKDEKRIYNIMNTTTDAGRNAEANHYLIDAVIKEFAGSNLLFDFEGSDLPGVKSFYQKFGAIDQPYYHCHFNKLPFPLNLLKK